MPLRAIQFGLAVVLAATIATSAQARATEPCPSTTTIAAPVDRGADAAAAACAALSGRSGHAEFALSLILIGCAAGIGGRASRRRGVKLVFS